MRARRRTIAASAAACGGALAAMAATLLGSSAPPDPWALRLTAGDLAPNLVIAGRGRRPVWSFVVVAPGGDRDVGAASVDWAPSGRDVCASGPAPLGEQGTRVSIRFHTPAALAGTTVADLDGPEGCATATGAWRGADGPLRGRRGEVTLRVDDQGIVRLTFAGLSIAGQ